VNEFGIAGYLYHKPILHDKSMSLIELPAVASGAGVQVLELCSVFFENQSAAYLNEVRRSLESAGMRVPSIAVDRADISVPEVNEQRTNIETIKQWFHVARAIDAESIRVNSGGAQDASEDELQRITEAYRELVEEGAQMGVYVLIENHGGATYSPANVDRFLKEVDSPWFRTCPDTGNYPDGTWEEGISVMAPYAASTHIKVTAYNDDGWQPRTGRDGTDRTVNLLSILQTLKENNFEGPYCIEVGVEPDETEAARNAISYVTRLLECV
jgi:sugar phosphate isomerase/epimerase